MGNNLINNDDVFTYIHQTLYCQKNLFYPQKNYGSRLRSDNALNNEKALSYARQALRYIDGVYVENAVMSENNVAFDVLLNNEKRQVIIEL